MRIDEFSKEIKRLLRSRIDKVNKLILSGRLKVTAPYHLPTSIRIIETPTQFIAELVGAQIPTANDSYHLATHTPETFNSSADYFCPGFPVQNATPIVTADTHHSGLANLACVTEYDLSIVHKKLGITLPPVEIKSSNNASIPLWIGPNADVFGLKNISIIRTDKQRVLFRYISSAVIFQKSHTVDSMIYEFNNFIFPFYFYKDFGFITDSSHRSIALAKHIHSLADQKVGEKIFDKLLREHEDIFALALGKRSAKFQVRLEWQSKSPPVEVSIPDFMMEREDGYYDILDLKRGLRNRLLTRGNAARPMYQHDVEELISQLSTYAEYFDHEENRRWAQEHYGIKTKDINIIGIIGNYDSIDSEVMERLQKRSPNLFLLDYNSLAQKIGGIAYP